MNFGDALAGTILSGLLLALLLLSGPESDEAGTERAAECHERRFAEGIGKSRVSNGENETGLPESGSPATACASEHF